MRYEKAEDLETRADRVLNAAYKRKAARKAAKRIDRAEPMRVMETRYATALRRIKDMNREITSGIDEMPETLAGESYPADLVNYSEELANALAKLLENLGER